MSKTKSITGMHLGSTYRRNKHQYKTAEIALKAILKKYPKERENNLTASHSEKQWIWKAKTSFD